MFFNSRSLCADCSRVLTRRYFSGLAPPRVGSVACRTLQQQQELLQKRLASSVPGSNVAIHVPKDRLVPQDSDMAQPIAFEDLPRAQQRFVKQFEELNFLRIKDIFRKNKLNILGFTVFSCLVAAIYYYTIHAVRQETFLEEIDQEVAEEKGEVRPKSQK